MQATTMAPSCGFFPFKSGTLISWLSNLNVCTAVTNNLWPTLNFHNFKVFQPKRVKILGTYEQFGKCEKQEMKLLKFMAPPLMEAVIALSPICNPPVSLGQTMDAPPQSQRGAALFRRACIGCHDLGGNIIQPGATLFLKDLQRNGVDTEEEIYRVTYYGKGRIPGFGENCTPRGQCTFGPRLQEDEIKLLAEFVKSQADQGWPKIEIEGD